MIKRHLVLTTAACAMLAASAIAQTGAPSPSAPSPAPAAPTMTAPPASTATPDQNLAMPGKWRASKLMGVDIYGPDNKKVGDVTEVVFDKAGMIEMVTVGVGGFLGMGAKDVAIPFKDITWMDTPPASATGAPAPTGSSPAPTGSNPAPAAPAGVTAQKAMNMYPDHGMITMTKDQLSSAPAVSFTGS